MMRSFGVTKFDPWFLARIREIIEAEAGVRCAKTACPVTEHGIRRSENAGLH